MGKDLVNLNVNPCKMCMPMGAVSAFAGIKGCMSILHGSQGCATYIRRHMATHYNEPVDIASSSLSEQGTVFGGEDNLKKGLTNLIGQYRPEVIGIATTCLAETIGEDIERIVDHFRTENPGEAVRILRVAAAGYGGSQYEGYFQALRSIVEQVTVKSEPGSFVNVITPMLSPADTRWLKSFLRESGLSFVLLPDLSDNLDGVSVSRYERLKTGGTSLDDVARMSGARMTIELSESVADGMSPGKYLEESFGVPLVRLPLPVGIESMERLTDVLVSAGGTCTNSMEAERGRYLDATVDAHKYVAQSRVAVFGEADFVKSVVRLCCETGSVPVVAATGSLSAGFRAALEPMIREAAERAFIEKYTIADDADFEQIEAWCLENGVNLMIGSSEARRISEKHGIPLIRAAFPIHDHIGGQRVQTLGYTGSLFLLDGIANAMIDHTHKTYRSEIAGKYLGKPGELEMPEKPEQPASAGDLAAVPVAPAASEASLPTPEQIAEKTRTHPCYSCSSCGTSARMHLPIAPKCNIQCNYCVRKFDCPNESRPGVTTEVLSPAASLEKFRAVRKEYPNLTVVGIAGPGDALANFEETKDALTLIRQEAPDMTFCLSTNGLMLPFYADELIRLGVTHVTVTMNAVDPRIGARIYKHVDYLGMRLSGTEGAAVLLANQLAGIHILVSRGIMVKVNCVAIKGINDGHLDAVTKKARELGAFMTNIMPHIAVAGSAFESLERLNNKELEQIRKSCEANIKQMRHCRQCRADAIGTLDDDQSIRFRKAAGRTEEPAPPRTHRVAVATRTGMIVDLHFGHADEFHIYETDGTTVRFAEKRNVEKYCSGKSDCDDSDSKIDRILHTLEDCEYALALRIGDSPKRKLKERGIRPVMTYDTVTNAVLAAVSKSAQEEE